MHTYLFVNPASGSYSSQCFGYILSRLKTIGPPPTVFTVRTPAEVFSCCTTFNQGATPCRVVVAAGDGTLNAVVNALNPGATTLAVLPLGTSNVLASEIGITSIEDGVARIAAGKTCSLSVGVIELEGKSLRFILMAGIGLDGAVVRDVWPLGKRLLRQGAYALSAIKRTMTWDPTVFKISTPEVDVICHTAIICNASRYGGNFILSPTSSPFLPGLSAVCIKGNTRRIYVRSVLDLFRNKAVTNQDLVRIQSSYFEVQGRSPIQIDGDFVGYGPARISESIDFARIIV